MTSSFFKQKSKQLAIIQLWPGPAKTIAFVVQYLGVSYISQIEVVDSSTPGPGGKVMTEVDLPEKGSR